MAEILIGETCLAWKSKSRQHEIDNRRSSVEYRFIVDKAARPSERAASIAQRIQIKTRLARFDIGATTRTNLQLAMPLLIGQIDRIILHFYQYLERFPETRAILKGHDIALLREKQRTHWLQLFDCAFTDDYVRGTVQVGLAHFDARLPPHVYIAAYSFFLTELLRVLHDVKHEWETEVVIGSITKVIMLDMSIALDAFLLDAISPNK